MTRRTVDEWVGKTPDTAVSRLARDRVCFAQGDCCANCGRKFGGGLNAVIDHVVALINGGENRETNLQALCSDCHKVKTAADVALKTKVARVRSKHAGFAPRKSRLIPGSVGSGMRKRLNGTVIFVEE